MKLFNRKINLVMGLLLLLSLLFTACGDASSTPIAGPGSGGSSATQAVTPGSQTPVSPEAVSRIGPDTASANTNNLTTPAGSSSPSTVAGVGTTAAATTNTRPPNIVFLLTDDLDAKEIEFMPKLKTLLVDQGLTFSNYFVTDSLCCPSRSSIQRGQYVHNHQVLGNSAPEGGFSKFYAVGDQNSTVATWLKAAGYRTALMGKYLNGYPDTAGESYVPPGWDEWDSPVDNAAYSEFNYKLNENGKIISHGQQPQDYLTDVISSKAASFIKSPDPAGSAAPFFIYLASYAPHQPATPAPRHANLFPNVTAPRTASVNEADVSDKPNFIKNLPLLTTQQLGQIDDLYRKRLQSLQAVDDMIGNLYDTLKATNQLDNTYFFFSSDNGFHLGQHRMLEGKQTAYDEDIHVPLIVRGPGIAAGKTSDAMTLEIDLAPTFARLGGAKTPDFVDGRSLISLLEGGVSPADWRKGVLIEHYSGSKEPFQSSFEDQQTGTGTSGGQTPAASGTLTPEVTKNAKAKKNPATAPALTVTPGPGVSPGASSTTPQASAQAQTGQGQAKANKTKGKGKAKKGGSNSTKMIPTYKAFRTAEYLYVEYSTGEKELYNLKADPAELDNLITRADPGMIKQYAVQLAAMGKCSAGTCLATEAK